MMSLKIFLKDVLMVLLGFVHKLRRKAELLLVKPDCSETLLKCRVRQSLSVRLISEWVLRVQKSISKSLNKNNRSSLKAWTSKWAPRATNKEFYSIKLDLWKNPRLKLRFSPELVFLLKVKRAKSRRQFSEI